MEADFGQAALVDFARNLPGRWLRRLLTGPIRWIEHVLGISELNAIYSGVRCRCAMDDAGFFRASMEETGLARRVANRDLLKIPETGPVVVVANHPLGALDAIALADLVISLRPDTKVMANHLLTRMPESHPWLIPVDPFSGSGAGRRNVGSMKRALRWLNQGGVLVVFPAGEVSHLHLGHMTVTDPEWNIHAAQLIQRTRASVVPVFIEGRNSWVFQVLGLIHPRLRTLLLVREMARSRRMTVGLQIGNALPATEFDHMSSPGEITHNLRIRTYVLQGRSECWKTPGDKGRAVLRPVAGAEDPDVLASEIISLPPERMLVRHQAWEIYFSKGNELPAILREIGRLRELSFRDVGEGTGKSADLDAYDGHYVHLFLWDRAARCVVGAYRIGLADEILRTKGVGGLYTRSLFHFRPSFVRGIGPALELGRSFISPGYQKKYGTLNLIWRGIGEFVVRHPDYHTLFGPVSISRDYHEISRNLLVQFLRCHKQDKVHSHQTRPRRPHRGPWLPGLGLDTAGGRIRTLEDVSAVISEIENDGKGVPVLLRHYLRLNAKLVDFNVDPSFTDALDGLAVVDLRESDPRLLGRFMGHSGLARFGSHHRGAADRCKVVGGR